MVALETVNNQYLGGDTSLACSNETATKIDAAVVAVVKQAHEKAVGIIRENMHKLDEIAQFLLEKETITGEGIYGNSESYRGIKRNIKNNGTSTEFRYFYT